MHAQVLAAVAEARNLEPAELDAGVHAIGKKIVEEAAEVWMAAEFQTDDETAAEISQLLYHLQVLMLAKGLTLADVDERCSVIAATVPVFTSPARR